jgi:hypothetical protein
MAALPRDHRGFPEPVILLRDGNGRAQFTVNDPNKVVRLTMERGCHVCGSRLGKRAWFVGGPLSAFHPAGVYNDGPVHRECMEYAMQVCPYLAGRMSAGKRVRVHNLREPDVTLVDRTRVGGVPPLFVAVGADAWAVAWDTKMHPTFKPHRPYQAVQFWRDGTRLKDADGEQLCARAVTARLPEESERETPRLEGR